MFWNGKIVGLILGALLGGPIGLVIGLLLGHLYDVGILDPFLAKFHWQRRVYYQQEQIQQVFFQATFMVMGYIAKLDGRISEQEIIYARTVMQRMGLNEQQAREAIYLFNSGKQPNFNPEVAILKLKKSCWHNPQLLRTFLELQIQCALIDRQMTPQKRIFLERMCQELGIVDFNFEKFTQQSQAEENYRQSQQSTQYNVRQYLADAYKILGVEATVSDHELKKAYRRMMSKHHPDKLISQGMPAEMIKIATQKTQQIKKAYETIKQARGL